uniref:Sulfotransferase n=1 Tax=Kalanchoe fedtschenkoi TaxID=63787 RepID=A0A7N0SV49_KALFE
METETASDEDSFSAFPKHVWYKDELLYQLKGFWFRPHYLEGVQRVLNLYKPRPTDVLLASFPKTGTTWMKSLIYFIVSRSSGSLLDVKHPHELVPSLELQVYNSSAGQSSNAACCAKPRLLSTHIPYQILGEAVATSDCRVVYVTRNPKDTLASLAHFIAKADNDSDLLSPAAATDMFLKGFVPFGPYYEHVLGFWKEHVRRPASVFFVTYEELQESPGAHVKRLAEFLNCPFEGEEEVDEVVRKCEFGNLSGYAANRSSEVPEWIEAPYSSFFRRGTVGDHKNYLEEKDAERIDEMTKEKFHLAGFTYGV